MTTTPSDPSYGSEWGLSAVGASSAWDTTTGSSAVVVADIDTGLDYTHPDLYQNVWLNQSEIPSAVKKVLTDTDGDGLITFRDLNAAANKGKVKDVDGNGQIDAADILTRAKYGGWADGVDEGKNGYVDDLVGWDFANNDRNPFDYDGHGTHTAGTIGATGDNGTGVSGVDWQVSLMAVKIFDDQGNSASDRVIAAAIRYSANNGAQVSNNSWGGGAYSTAIYNAIAYAGTKGQLFVVAAGNDSANLDSRFYNDYPSEYALDNILVVGATTSGGSRAYYSNYGQTAVDVFAPGSNVLSTYLGGTYETMSGTSMAAPHVAGAAALMLAANGKLTAAQLKARIIAGADQTASLAGTSVAAGELNVANAVADTGGARFTGSASSGLVIISRPGRWRRFSVPIPVPVPAPMPMPMPMPMPTPVQPPVSGSTPGTGQGGSSGSSTTTSAAAPTTPPPAAATPAAIAGTARQVLDGSTTGLVASAASAGGSEVSGSTTSGGRSVFSDRRVSATSAGYEPANVSRMLAADGLAARSLSSSPAPANVPSSIDGRGAAIASTARAAWGSLGPVGSLAGDAASGVVPDVSAGEFSTPAGAAGVAAVAEAWSLTGLRAQLAAIAASVAVFVAGGYTYVRGRRVAARAGATGLDGDGESGDPIEFPLRH